MSGEEHRQVVVVGGGPAGVSCALECLDVQLDIVLLEGRPRLGGQLPDIAHAVRNVVFEGVDRGPELQHSLQRSSQILGDRVRLGHPVTAVDLAERRIQTEDRRWSADSIVIATGARRRALAAAPDGACGGDVTYQLEREPTRFAGRAVAVVGGGDSAALDALELARAGSPVMLVHRSAELTARRDIVVDVRREPGIADLAGWEVESLAGRDHLEAITLVQPATGKRRREAVGGLVVKISYEPATELFAGQLELDRHGSVVVDAELRTSRRGVLAAGDVTAGAYPRIATATGQGLLAARTVLHQIEGRGA